ncbi:MAG: VIT1/CCC1 transporter family protein [Thermoplasmata archaeon]|nr:VIT1/CCC1 transporter family protein [Thermoplasmata archaeon]
MLNHFVRGIIDGLLSTLGVVIGASAADTAIVLAAGIGGAVANGVSNCLGAFSSEEYKGHMYIQKIEFAMQTKGLEDSQIGKKMKKERLKAGLLDGSSTIIGGFIPVVPFILLEHDQALVWSVLSTVITLFILGAYIGKVSKKWIIFSGLKLMILGVLTALLVYLIQHYLV